MLGWVEFGEVGLMLAIEVPVVESAPAVLEIDVELSLDDAEFTVELSSEGELFEVELSLAVAESWFGEVELLLGEVELGIGGGLYGTALR